MITLHMEACLVAPLNQTAISQAVNDDGLKVQYPFGLTCLRRRLYETNSKGTDGFEKARGRKLGFSACRANDGDGFTLQVEVTSFVPMTIVTQALKQALPYACEPPAPAVVEDSGGEGGSGNDDPIVIIYVVIAIVLVLAVLMICGGGYFCYRKHRLDATGESHSTTTVVKTQSSSSSVKTVSKVEKRESY